MAEDQPVPARRGPTVRARGDLSVRPADTHGHRLDQDGTGTLLRFGDLLEANRACHSWVDRDCLHRSLLRRARCAVAARFDRRCGPRLYFSASTMVAVTGSLAAGTGAQTSRSTTIAA